MVEDLKVLLLLLLLLLNLKLIFVGGAPSPSNSAMLGRHVTAKVASYHGRLFPIKNKINIIVRTGPHIKLMRTDTTLS